MTSMIANQITEFVRSNFVFDDSEVAIDASFMESGLIDSTGILEVILFLEETFDIAVDDEDVLPEHFDSVARLAAYVDRKLAAGRVAVGAD